MDSASSDYVSEPRLNFASLASTIVNICDLRNTWCFLRALQNSHAHAYTFTLPPHSPSFSLAHSLTLTHSQSNHLSLTPCIFIIFYYSTLTHSSFYIHSLFRFNSRIILCIFADGSFPLLATLAFVTLQASSTTLLDHTLSMYIGMIECTQAYEMLKNNHLFF